MGSLKNLNDTTSAEEERDVLGGGDFVWDSNTYEAIVDMAYIEKPTTGSIGITVHFKDATGRELRDTHWIQSRKDKGGKTYYEKDGKQYHLPGYNAMNALTLLTLGKEFTDVDDEEKTINLWNFDQGGKVPTSKNVLVELLGQKIVVGVLRKTVNKNVKNDAGNWVASGDTKDKNEIDRYFRMGDHLTVTEIKENKTSPDFYDKWKKKWTGVTKNEATTVASGATAGMPGASTAPVTKSLFPS